MITKPKGTYDIYGKNTKKWQFVNKMIDEFCLCYNYEYIRTPILKVANYSIELLENLVIL